MSSHVEEAWARVEALADNLEVNNPQRWIVRDVVERWPRDGDDLETAPYVDGLRKRERLPLVLAAGAGEPLCAG